MKRWISNEGRYHNGNGLQWVVEWLTWKTGIKPRDYDIIDGTDIHERAFPSEALAVAWAKRNTKLDVSECPRVVRETLELNCYGGYGWVTDSESLQEIEADSATGEQR